MNKEEFIGKLQLIYVGDKRASEEIVSEYDRLNNIINELEKWIKENNLGKYRTENVVNTDELLDKLKALKENK